MNHPKEPIMKINRKQKESVSSFESFAEKLTSVFQKNATVFSDVDFGNVVDHSEATNGNTMVQGGPISVTTSARHFTICPVLDARGKFYLMRIGS